MVIEIRTWKYEFFLTLIPILTMTFFDALGLGHPSPYIN